MIFLNFKFQIATQEKNLFLVIFFMKKHLFFGKIIYHSIMWLFVFNMNENQVSRDSLHIEIVIQVLLIYLS